ncbi:MAG TPA: PAS domain S-box protein [Gemmatimonadales bacterium]|jgi:PAS domain S-box-containing protein|nr:PAS domain S-box protein [Gemmatimonadales bacterium]
MIDFAVLQQPERLAALRRLALANLEPEEAFDRLTRLATVLFSTPIALITFVTDDRQYYKSSRGLPEPFASSRETPLSYSICQYVVASGEPLVVPDARQHPLLSTNPAVTELGAVAYAGVPLVSSDGDCLGTFCVADARPRRWTDEQVGMLRDLAATVMTELELRRELTDRARIEEKLRESEARFRAMVEQSQVGIALWDDAGQFLFANHCLAQLLARPEEDLARLSLWDVIQPDDLRGALPPFDRLAGGGPPLVLEWRYLRPDGSSVWANTTASSVRDAGGQVEYVVGIVQDITHRKQAEAALAKAQRQLRRSEEHFRTLIEHVSDIITIVDESGVILYGSPSVERVLGYLPVDLVGRSAVDLIHPDDRPRLLEAQRAAAHDPLATPRGVEFRFRHRDGSWRTLEALGSALQYRSAGPRAVFTLRDVTERQRTDAALRESEERLRLTLDAANCGIWDWDIPTNHITWSERVYQLHGLTPDTFGGRMEDFRAVIHPEDVTGVSEAIRRSLEEQADYTTEFRVVHPGTGEIRWIWSNGRVLRDREGRPARMLGATLDTTERRRAEEALLASHEQLRLLAHRLDEVREQELTRISREVHDELGHALTALRLDLGWLVPKLNRNREPVRRKADEMLALVDDTIDTVRRIASELRPPVLEDLGLAAGIEGLLERFAGQTGSVVELLAPSDDVPRVARRPLYRIVQEALTNIARHAQASRVTVVLECPPERVLLEVADNGVGIAPGVLARRGSLGLLGMRERAAAIGADFEVRSGPTGGTIIRVSLPRPST